MTVQPLDAPESPYGRYRLCPQCRTRVAQRADTCYACGAALAGSRRRWRLALPWADIVLFAVIAGLVMLWWTDPLATASTRSSIPSVEPTPTAGQQAAGIWRPNISPEPTATPTPPASASPISPTATPTPIPTVKEHKVVAGESVGLIAEKYGIKVKDLLTFNNMGSDRIVPGQILKIPGGSLPATATPVPTPTGGTLIYRVQAGDTIAGLAAKYGADLNVMLEANKMNARSILSIGQVIQIPLGGAATPSPTPTDTPTAAPPTFTPGAVQRAPALLLPPENGPVNDRSPLLSWTSVGLLAEDEWYVVLLRPAGVAQPLTPYWTKITSWRVPADYRVDVDGPVNYTWQVQVVKGRPDDPSSAPTPLGPASPPRHFIWR